MKKLFFARGVAALIVMAFLIPSQVLAAVTKLPSDIVPDTTTMYFEFDLNQLPSSLSDKITGLLAPELSSSAESNALEEKKLFVDILSAKRLYFAMNQLSFTSMDSAAFILPVSDVQWSSILNLHKDAIKSVLGSHDFYVDTGTRAFTKLDGYFLLGSEEYIQKLIKSYDQGTFLSQSSKYANTVKKLSAGNFFTMFVDLGSSLKTIKDEMSAFSSDASGTSPLFSAFKEMALGVQKMSNGVKVETVIQKGSTASAFASTPFLPNMYLLAPAKKPLGYFEGYNLKKLIDTQLATYSALLETSSSEFSQESIDAVGFDIQKDLLGLLTKGYSLTAEQNSSSMIPYFTFMADVKGSEATMKSTLTKLYNKAKSTAQTDGTVIMGPTTAGGADWGLTGPLGDTGESLSIRFDVTTDGVLLISTDPSIGSKYKTGLDATLFGTNIANAKTTSMLMIDLQQIALIFKQYAQRTYNDLNASDKKFFNISALLTNIDTIASPWSSIVATGSDDGASISSQLLATFDDSVFTAGYWTNAVKAGKVIDDLYKRYDRLTSKFLDVKENAWFANDIKQLKIRGIAKGYYDKNFNEVFKPGNNVTRAEFLTMLYRGVYGEPSASDTSALWDDLENSSSSLDDGGAGFHDVSISDWYFDTIMLSAKNGLVKGYTDGSFKPNALISRAEAVAMIQRFYDYNNDLEFFVDLPWRDDRDFSDVAGSAWFSEPVHKSYQLGILDGTPQGSFEPGRSLNRAEAAKLINKLLRVKFERE